MVNLLDKLGRQHVTNLSDFLVDGEGLNVQVGGPKNGTGGSLVDTTALHADEAVLHNIDTANPVATTNLVEEQVPMRNTGRVQ